MRLIQLECRFFKKSTPQYGTTGPKMVQNFPRALANFNRLTTLRLKSSRNYNLPHPLPPKSLRMTTGVKKFFKAQPFGCTSFKASQSNQSSGEAHRIIPCSWELRNSPKLAAGSWQLVAQIMKDAINVSKENYLKAILEAEAEGRQVIPAMLAHWLEVSAPAVTMALKRLSRDGYVEMSEDGIVRLTETGRETAYRTALRHHLIERMLSESFRHGVV